MSWTYDPSNSRIYYVRLLISDTNVDQQIFSDEEINAAYAIQASQFQSSMFFSGSQGANLPAQPISYLRVSALLLDSLAANNARLAVIKKLLDVTLDAKDAAAALRACAQGYRDVEDNSGAFVIIEQVSTVWGFVDRYWATVQRQTGN